jgi:poly-gamma-glutamate capsule biosynthesis protein CapA/YwtB (metallophosphatase superfamily)
MTGRGIDQLFATPSRPQLFEGYVRDARDYLRLAERRHGPLPRPVPPDYVWGDALQALAGYSPDLRIANLETAVTTSDQPWPSKGIHYRMHPANVACLTAAGLDCCVLGNNHVLDWGRGGLLETLDCLRACGIATAGAGADLASARAPAVLPLADDRRLKVFSFGTPSSGVPLDWAATDQRPGVNVLPDLLPATAGRIADLLRRQKADGDLMLVSIHWGGNWGYDVPAQQRTFARTLVDRGGVDLIHGHSSHHPRGIEIHHGRPILYGCGDFLNDYEGIRGYEALRPDLTLMYVLDIEPDGETRALRMVPMQIRRMQLAHASPNDAAWLAAVLSRECRGLGGDVILADGELRVIR